MFNPKKISRRNLLKTGVLAAMSNSAVWTLQKAVALQSKTVATPVLREFNYGAVQFADGLHQKQLNETMDTLLSLSEDSLLMPFRLRAGLPAPGVELGGWYDEDPKYNYQDPDNDHGFAPGHCFGQWISAFTRAYAISGAQPLKDKAERLINLYAKTISPKFFDGFRWPTYTYDKMVCALMDAHQFIGFKNAFSILNTLTDTAAPFFPEKALDHEEMRLRPHKDESYCWDESYTIPENLFIVYNRGAGDRYKDLAIRFLKDDTYFNPLSEGKNILAGHHAYSYTNALSSAMQAYLTLGSEKHFLAAKNAFDMIHDTQSFATGGWGPDEAFRKVDSKDMFDGLSNTHHSFETPCGSYAHFKLTRYLLRVTRDPKYGDSMEQVMYNTILGAKKLQEDGRAFYYSDYNFAGKKIYHHKWTCCAGTLPQIGADYHVSAYFADNDGVFVNLYIPSTLKWKTDSDKEISLSQKGDYPFEEQIEFVIDTQSPFESAIRFRIPSWAEGAKIKLNGRQVPANELASPATAGSFACIKRKWESGDRIELELPMKIRLEALDRNHSNIVAIQRGPLVLFAITDKKPQATREQLMTAKRNSKSEWSVSTSSGDIRLLPFTSIEDEQYSTYFELMT